MFRPDLLIREQWSDRRLAVKVFYFWVIVLFSWCKYNLSTRPQEEERQKEKQGPRKLSRCHLPNLLLFGCFWAVMAHIIELSWLTLQCMSCDEGSCSSWKCTKDCCKAACCKADLSNERSWWGLLVFMALQWICTVDKVGAILLVSMQVSITMVKIIQLMSPILSSCMLMPRQDQHCQWELQLNLWKLHL